MNKSKHTPGPWCIPGSSNLVGTEGEHRRLIAETHGEDRDANAALIAASPAMFAAGEKLAAWAARAVERWESGDLAEAVRNLDYARQEWIKAVESVEERAG